MCPLPRSYTPLGYGVGALCSCCQRNIAAHGFHSLSPSTHFIVCSLVNALVCEQVLQILLQEVHTLLSVLTEEKEALVTNDVEQLKV
jgi:hypothetical protein